MLQNDNILVLIQLVGGNDSLSAIVPLDSFDNLIKHRENILIPQSKLLKTGAMGFHPSMEGLFNLYKEGEMCAVNNVGYPSPNRSHFRSMDIWNSGSPSNEQWNTGWLGRLLDIYHQHFPDKYPNLHFPDPLAITVGNIVSDTCQGQFHNFSHVVDNLETFTEINKCKIAPVSNTNYNQLMEFLDSTITLTNSYAKQIEVAAGKGKNLVDYPNKNNLAQELKTVAKLISGGLGTKIYVLSLGGFDTHAYQTSKNDPTLGMHAIFLKILSEAVSIFIKDLKLLNCFENVSVMTYSEFGRQIKSNSAFGTDHGDATSIYLFGNKLKSQMIGNLPQIKNEVEKQSGLDIEIDFRHLYSSLLHEWFSVPQEKTLGLFNIEHKQYELFKMKTA